MIDPMLRIGLCQEVVAVGLVEEVISCWLNRACPRCTFVFSFVGFSETACCEGPHM